MSVITVDEKSRIVLDKKIREVSGLKKKSRLVAIPFRGGVTLVDITGKSFVGSKPGFKYKEDEHEASKFLFEKLKSNSNQRKRKR
jgi:bifunctional DNA-binding transcriptional regulator/antitoxin component of YhaV-PrlF toxin-antitoxin module